MAGEALDLDELAHYVNDREVYRGSTALILRSYGQLTGCSTPLGRRGIFWEIANQELRKYPHHRRQHVPWWLCRFFCSDVEAAARIAPDLPTEERVARFGRPTLIVNGRDSRGGSADLGLNPGAPVGHHHPPMAKQRIKELLCPSCQRQFALTAWQEGFITRAADKGMAMVCLECQLCRMYFEFNPCAKSVGTSLVSRPRKTKTEPALTLKEKRAVLKAWAKLGTEIPKSYTALLMKMPKGTTLRLKGRDWQLHTLEELNKKTQIDRRRVLQIREMQVWAKTLREAFGGAEETQDEAGRGYAFARLAEGISIGSENEDILFMDPSDGYSLWCLYPSEGGDVERLAKRLDPVVARLEKKLTRTR